MSVAHHSMCPILALTAVQSETHIAARTFGVRGDSLLSFYSCCHATDLLSVLAGNNE